MKVSVGTLPVAVWSAASQRPQGRALIDRNHPAQSDESVTTFHLKRMPEHRATGECNARRDQTSDRAAASKPGQRLIYGIPPARATRARL